MESYPPPVLSQPQHAFHAGYDQPPQGQPQQMPVTAQPVQQNTTVVVQPAAPQLVITTSRPWSSGMCSCFNEMGSCLMGTFCGTCYLCHLSSEMDESCCVPICVPGAMVALRTKLRTQHNIQGSILDDCCKSTFCGPCVLCQLAREIKHVRSQVFHPMGSLPSAY